MKRKKIVNEIKKYVTTEFLRQRAKETNYLHRKLTEDDIINLIVEFCDENDIQVKFFGHHIRWIIDHLPLYYEYQYRSSTPNKKRYITEHQKNKLLNLVKDAKKRRRIGKEFSEFLEENNINFEQLTEFEKVSLRDRIFTDVISLGKEVRGRFNPMLLNRCKNNTGIVIEKSVFYDKFKNILNANSKDLSKSDKRILSKIKIDSNKDGSLKLKGKYWNKYLTYSEIQEDAIDYKYVLYLSRGLYKSVRNLNKKIKLMKKMKNVCPFCSDKFSELYYYEKGKKTAGYFCRNCQFIKLNDNSEKWIDDLNIRKENFNYSNCLRCGCELKEIKLPYVDKKTENHIDTLESGKHKEFGSYCPVCSMVYVKGEENKGNYGLMWISDEKIKLLKDHRMKLSELNNRDLNFVYGCSKSLNNLGKYKGRFDRILNKYKRRKKIYWEEFDEILQFIEKNRKISINEVMEKVNEKDFDIPRSRVIELLDKVNDKNDGYSEHLMFDGEYVMNKDYIPGCEKVTKENYSRFDRRLKSVSQLRKCVYCGNTLSEMYIEVEISHKKVKMPIRNYCKNCKKIYNNIEWFVKEKEKLKKFVKFWIKVCKKLDKTFGKLKLKKSEKFAFLKLGKELNLSILIDIFMRSFSVRFVNNNKFWKNNMYSTEGVKLVRLFSGEKQFFESDFEYLHNILIKEFSNIEIIEFNPEGHWEDILTWGGKEFEYQKDLFPTKVLNKEEMLKSSNIPYWVNKCSYCEGKVFKAKVKDKIVGKYCLECNAIKLDKKFERTDELYDRISIENFVESFLNNKYFNLTIKDNSLDDVKILRDFILENLKKTIDFV